MAKNEVLKAIASKYGLSEEALKELQGVIAPIKQSTVATPDILVDGEVTERFCKIHKRYEPIVNYASLKSKECRAGSWRWAQITKSMDEVVADILDNEHTKKEIDTLRQQYHDLKTSRSLAVGTGYDFEKDWADFNALTTEPQES